MYLQSPFEPCPEPPIQNYHDFQFGLPNVVATKDYTVFIDAFTNERRTLREFQARVSDAATALAALGLEGEKGDVVGILSENNMEFPTLVHALIKVAVPMALVPSFSTPSETTALMKLARVTQLFVSPKKLPMAREAARKIGLPDEKIYILQGKVEGRRSLADMINDVRANGTLRVASRPVKKDTLAYLIFSSGTSGLPKAVMLSHRNLCCSLLQSIQLAKEVAKYGTTQPSTADAPAVSIAFLPMYHAMCLHNVIFRGLISPTTFIIMPRWDINAVLELVPRYKVTALAMVPSIVHQLVHHPKIRQTDLSSLTYLGGGAAYLSWELRQTMLKYAGKVPYWAEGYGMSECSVSAMWVPPPGIFGGPKPGMTGVLLANQEARIVREDMSECDWNEPGELLLRGGNVAMGYWDNPKATKETFIEGGWLRTGDRFLAKEDGGLYYVDRIKDTLKISGIQVSPTEIEDTLLSHPSQPPLISDVVVAGVMPLNSRLSDEPVPRAWVVLTEEGRKIGAEEVVRKLDAWHKEALSKYKWLRGGFGIVDQIPKSPTGKVLRRHLQEEYKRSLPAQAKL
ncbi:acetyl-CoA synthetase-like protein [Stereum hirsutum FP-91666 SS1]|uniref:acetyl-CoA synthetase-like protein n=1 Tax=Stereum hirsutum (strain FP-91666) TaxID=721885 RepID=UPI000444A6D7|nr:acetyl-CoA synthetase-like protein [Stereum hirsutum FP-91666 SS1]EIM81740.1 acetyl-CoA synthetase-like protein [Stereum hirsutum FP-91666 SS1]